ncbi:MAG: carboxypeptidase regulatory-like domain-containing protein [Planctomycetota bacterium]
MRAGTAEVTVVLEPGFAVHGLVCERGTKAPVPGALVGIIPNDAPPEHTQTDARGEYRFAHLRGGSALLVVNALGWEEVRRRFDISVRSMSR